MSRHGTGSVVGSALRSLVRGRTWVVVGILATLAPAVAISLLSPPRYRAEARVSVQLTVPDQTLASQIAVLEGDEVYQRVRQQLAAGDAPPRPEGRFGAQPNVMIVRVESRDAITSSVLADAYATAYASLSAADVAIQQAETPDDPFTRPRWITWLIALAAGAVLGSLAALWIDRRDGSVIGRIPNYPTPDSRPVMLRNPTGRAADAYRTLRDNMENADPDRPPQVIVVTGVGSGVGVTTTAVNLALAYVQLGLRVVLIDANLRAPTLHRIFAFDGSRGLVDNLADTPLESTIHSLADALFVIAAGPIPSNPLEVLSRRRMDELVEEIRDRFDLIVIDAPPVLDGGEAGLLARHADGVIIVSGSRATRPRELRWAQEQLDQVRAPSLGVVVNRDPTQRGESTSRRGG